MKIAIDLFSTIPRNREPLIQLADALAACGHKTIIISSFEQDIPEPTRISVTRQRVEEANVGRFPVVILDKLRHTPYCSRNKIDILIYDHPFKFMSHTIQLMPNCPLRAEGDQNTVAPSVKKENDIEIFDVVKTISGKQGIVVDFDFFEGKKYLIEFSDNNGIKSLAIVPEHELLIP